MSLNPSRSPRQSPPKPFPVNAWTAAAPIIASAVGSGISARGGKKAAKHSQPQIPQQFAGPAGAGANYLWNAIAKGGLPQYGGTFTAGMTPLQNQGLNFVMGNQAAAQGGLDSALRTITGASESGFNPQDLQLAKNYLQPYYDYQRQQGLAQTREGEAQTGRFYSSGGVGAESNFLNQLNAQQTSQLLPLATQMAQYRLGAAQSLPGFLGGQQALGMGMFGLGEQQRQIQQGDLTAKYQEFLRTQPMAAISALAGLMGGTPFYNPAQAPNFAQMFGQGLSGLGSSPDFLKLIQAWQAQNAQQPPTGFMGIH